MRTNVDVVRSFKRYLAVSLASPAAPLAVAKWFPNPSSFSPTSVYPSTADPSVFAGARHVWFDLNVDGALDAAPLASPQSFLRDPTSAFVSMGAWNGVQFWGNTPGRRWDAGSSVFVELAADDSSVSPGLVHRCSRVSSDAWAAALSSPRWGFSPVTCFGDAGQPYRVAMLTEKPEDVLVGVDLSVGVTADELPMAASWDVRFSHDIIDLTYPLCIVKPVGAAALAMHAIYTEVTQPFVVYAYPAVPADGEPSEVLVRAEKVRAALVEAFAMTTNRNGAKPMRIPLYDYDGVPLAEGAGRRYPSDFLKVVDASVDLIPEPGDPGKAVVVADIRLNWRVSLDEGRGTTLAEALLLDLRES